MRKLKTFPRLLLREGGQDTFEYLLAVGAIVAVMLGTLIIGFQVLVPQVVDHVCPSVDTASNVVSTVGSCIQDLP